MRFAQRNIITLNTVFLTTLILAAWAGRGVAQEIPESVLDIFDESCAFSGCHAGPNSPNGLDLTEDFALASLVNRPSRDFGNEILRVQPRNPARSYLIMKIKDDPAIKGGSMPQNGKPLPSSQVKILEDWINSLPADLKAKSPAREYAEAFAGVSLSTLPTTQTLEKGFFAYRISHRWRGNVKSGFANFYGLDGGASIFTELLFALNNDLSASVGRANQDATFEFAGKWRFLKEKSSGGTPISAALVAGLDWNTRKNPIGVTGPLDRTDSERFHWFAQVPLSKQVHDKFSILFVPGVLLNGNVQLDDEDAIVTLGFGARLHFGSDFSLFVEGVPIVAGSDGAAVVGGPRPERGDRVFNDGFTVGLEKRVGGHVFHVYLTNSLGLATSHSMSGADFDFTERDLRLGFNIYRTLRLPF